MVIKQKIIVSMIMMTVVCAAAILISAIFLYSNDLTKTAYNRINISAATVDYELDRLKIMSSMSAAGIAGNQDLAQAVKANNRDEILYHAKNLQNIADVDFCSITDKTGTVLARTHEPDNYGDSIANQSNVNSALSGKTATFIEQGSSVRLSVRTGAPIYDENNTVIGAVSVGFRLDTFDFVDTLKKITGGEVTIFLEDERISTTVKKDDGTRAVGTKAAAKVSEKVLAGQEYTGNAQVVGKNALTKYSPLYGPENKVIGMLFVGEYTEDDTNKIISFIISGLVVTLIILAASIFFSMFIAKTIEKQLINIINKIKSSAYGIKSETEGLTDISSSLADGASKQAASIEETSATMNETASMISQNAEHTRQATQIAEETKQSANTGKTKMQEMVKSMNQLKESSDTIAKIIKTIDDIAFQTNLLAINATVEAARASGDAGRSFAVVADEVRNLAKKSAVAASDTSEIIQKNIMLTNNSKGISEEVSLALETITTEFDRLSKVISEINAASEEQSRGVNQINIAIGQMEKQTQQNAAMAEETTASSNNLKVGANSLDEVISEASQLINRKSAGIDNI